MTKKSPLVVSALALAVSSAFAQSASETNNPLYQIASLDPVVVSAARYEQVLSATNVIVSVIDREQIEKSGVSNVVEYLDQIPGVSVSRLYGRMGNNARVDIGYLGENTGTNVLVLIDGFRVNNIDGEDIRYSQIPISSIDRIEVRTAGAGVLYGDRAMGGVINIVTRQEPSKNVTLSAGSFGYKKIDSYLSGQNESRLFSISAMYAESDGYRERTKSDHKTIRAGLRDGSSEGNFWSLQLRAFEEYAQLPGGITIATFNTYPRKAKNYNDYGERSGEQINFTFQRFFGEKSKYVLGVGHESSENYANLVSSSDVSTRNTKKSFIQPTVQMEVAPSLVLLGGLDMFVASVDVAGKDSAGQDSVAAFASLEQKFNNDFSVSVGFRRQGLKNTFKKTSGAAEEEDRKYLNAQSVGFSYLLSTSTKLRFGFVDGFRFPTTNELYYFSKTSPYAPTRIYPGVQPMTSEELYMVLDHKYGSGAIFASVRDVDTKGEIGFSSGAQCQPASTTEDCNRNLYDTNRKIFTLGVKHNLLSNWMVSASADYIDSEILSGTGKGKEIPLVPSYVYRLGLEMPLLSGLLALHANYRGEMYQSDYYSNTSDPGYRIPSRTLVDIGYIKEQSKNFKWNIWLRNLTDKQYYDFGQYGSESYGGVYPGDGRAVEASLMYSF